MKASIVVTFFLLIFSVNAYAADCTYSGIKYPPGSVVNGYVCKPDGTWGK